MGKPAPGPFVCPLAVPAVLWAAVLLLPALGARAGVVLTSIHSFDGGNGGSFSEAGLVEGSDGSFYGTTAGNGQSNSFGTVFKFSPNGVYRTLYSFRGGNDGGYPEAALAQGSDGYFYGTTYGGGTNGWDAGTVFKITTNGVLTTLKSFYRGLEGANPVAGMVRGSDGNFYGTTMLDGTNGWGTVFKITTNGAFALLYCFTGGKDGGYLQGGLVQGSDGYFYGTTCGQHPQLTGFGTVFKLSATGALTTLYSFAGGKDGAYPFATLVQASDGYFYGTTMEGGSGGCGTVFKLSASGSYSSLYSFSPAGSHPQAGLVLGSDGNFYGAASDGVRGGEGALFMIATNGAFTSLYIFTGSDGACPEAGLVQGNDGNFYGTTYDGGTGGFGTIFQLNVGLTSPVLTIDGIVPSFGPTSGGTIVTISGARFQNRATATFGTTAAASTFVNGAIRLTAVTPAGAEGAVNVIVTNVDGQTAILTNAFTYVIPPSFATQQGGIQFSNGQLYLQVTGPTSQSPVVLQASTDLTHWTSVLTNPSGLGAVQFIDPSVSNYPFRFYRALLPSP
jgi:uncharacterized repeat protein (TIGR03803 family)